MASILFMKEVDPKMKICFIMSAIASAGGEQRVVTALANALSVQNEVTIISVGDWEEGIYYPLYSEIRVIKMPIRYSLWQKIINKGNQKTQVLKGWEKLLTYSYIPRKLINRLKETIGSNFDVVVGVAGLYSIFLGYIADEISAMTIGWEHNSYEAYFCLPEKYYWHFDGIFKKYVRKLDHCVVLNEEIKEKYKTNLGIDTCCIYNPRSFESKEKSKQENPYFIASGRYTYQKGFDYLIEAFRLFSEKNLDWKLQILGDGEQRESIEEKIRQYHLTDRVELLGFQKEVKPYLINASVFLLSSRWEGFPMSVTEALEIGLPVISFDIGAIRPLISEGVEGMLVPPFNVDKFSAAMLKMAESDELRKECAICAVKKAQTLSIEKIMDEWNKVLRKAGQNEKRDI